MEGLFQQDAVISGVYDLLGHEVKESEAEEEEEAEPFDDFRNNARILPDDVAIDYWRDAGWEAPGTDLPDGFAIHDWRDAGWEAPGTDLPDEVASGDVNNGQTAELFTKLDAPEVVKPNAAFDVVLGLTAAEPDDGIEPIEVPVAFEFSMSIRTGFEFEFGAPQISFPVDLVKGDVPQRTVTVRAGEIDDEIHVLYFVNARLVGSAMHQVSVAVDAQAVVRHDRGRVHFDRSGDLDFLLRIAEHQGIVTVDAFAMGSSEPMSKLNRLGAELRTWFKDNIIRVPTSPDDATRVLKMRGLCREIAALLPRELVDRVLAFDGTPQILVMSKDPYVPWELAYLENEDDDEPGILLGAKAAVGRWPVDVETPERLPPREPVEVDEIVIVTADYVAKPLPHADVEATELAKRWRAAPVDGTLAEFVTLLNGQRPWRSLHVAVHGSNKPAAKSDGLLLTDASIDDAVIRGAERLGPLVFLNACEVGGGAGGLMSWAGLPAAFISRGAQAVVAPLWAIKDDTAKEAALAYYDLCQEHGPAEAIRRLRERFPVDSLQHDESVSWLAYQYFGHPALQVQLPRKNS